MIVTGEVSVVRQTRWAVPTLSWGLVPTMGYLHEGHLSLVRRAKLENDRVAVSIFVNPTQFAPGEDLAIYPQDLDRDLVLLETEEVDLVFAPSTVTMYPSGFQTSINVRDVTKQLEGSSRPTHFTGVSTIVGKLFNIVAPTKAYFGQKDAQQTVVIRRMIDDLNFNLDLVICPIVREPDGLAMSSRNSRLTANQRAAAPVLYRALQDTSFSFNAGERRGTVLRQIMTDTVKAEPLARLDYVSAADPSTLLELEKVEDEVLLSLAIFFDKVRLIDNMLLINQSNKDAK
jgi:pantoate--beta-alanine ligase